MKFKEAFMTLHGRDATPAEVLEYERLLRVLDTTPSDAILSVLVAMGHTRAVMEKIPGLVKQAAGDVANEMRGMADVEIQRSKSEIGRVAEENKGVLLGAVKTGATEAITTVAREIVTAAAQKSMAQWALLAFLVAGLAVLCTLFAGHYWGYNSAKNEAAAAAAWMSTAAGQRALEAYQTDPDRTEWAGTRDARQAYRMYKSGTLAMVADCNQPGWTSEKKNGVKYCYPFAMKGGSVYGWEMP